MNWGDVIKAEESSLVANSEMDMIKVSDWAKNGKYIGVCTEENGEQHVSPRIKITTSYITEKDEIRGLKIERYQLKKGIWEKDGELNLSNIGREKIASLIDLILSLDMKGVVKKYIPLEAEMEKIDEDTKRKLKTLLMTPDGKKLLNELAKSEISNEDIISIAYRKKQLNIFKKLLDQPSLIDKHKEILKITKPGHECAWQYFFEKNPWIFGLGLNYVFYSELDDSKLENIVSGADFNSGGKRVDALLKARGIISSFALVEIKTPVTPLIEKMERSESWSISKQLNDSIAQSHKTVMKFKSKYFDKAEIKDEQGNPTGEIIYNINPKNYLIIGNLDQFKTDRGINEDKYSSFELYRGNCANPEIITFDELYERASGILNSKGNE